MPASRRHVVYHAAAVRCRCRPDAEAAARARERLGIGPGPLVLYAGKLSIGKGTPVLLEALDAHRGRRAGRALRRSPGRARCRCRRAPDVHALGVAAAGRAVRALPRRRRRRGAVGVARAAEPRARGGHAASAGRWWRPRSAERPRRSRTASPGCSCRGRTRRRWPRRSSSCCAIPSVGRAWARAAAARAATVFDEERVVARCSRPTRARRRGRVSSRTRVLPGRVLPAQARGRRPGRGAVHFTGRVLDVGGARRRGAFRPPAGGPLGGGRHRSREPGRRGRRRAGAAVP